MPKVAVMNMQGAAVGEIELSDNTFGAEVNEAACTWLCAASWPPSVRALSLR